MRIVFYSNECVYCKKLLSYLEKNNIKSLFKLINIDETPPPPGIDCVPSIIDTELIQPLKGKAVFEYLLNLKYFNNPTNNIEYIKNIPINPPIKEDDKALLKNSNNFIIDTNIQTNTEVGSLFIKHD
jgi:hypothetical protein